MKKYLWLCLIILLAVSCTKNEGPAGVIQVVVGKAWVISGTDKIPAKQGSVLNDGDSIETGDNSVVIADINGGVAVVEIQKNALFRLESVKNDIKTVAIERGNLWLKVNKLLKNSGFRLKTPKSIAAVRGTKMYHFTIDDMDAVCHCEGEVEFKDNTGSYTAIHQRDHMVFTKGGSVILLTPEDIAFMNAPGQPHKHSELDNSILGQKAQPLTKEQQAAFMKLIQGKFNRTKNPAP